MAIVVPKGREAWPEKHPPFRVEYLERSGGVDRETGSMLCRVYFDGEAEASYFADAHTTWAGFPCAVESRYMPVTHEVHSLAVDTDYIRSIQRFGNIETATLAFNAGKVQANKHGGRYQLREVGNPRALAEFRRKAD